MFSSLLGLLASIHVVLLPILQTPRRACRQPVNLGSKTAQTLTDGLFYSIDAFTSANILRLARGCPKLVDLVWYLDGLTPLTDGNGQNVDDLTELLESRAKQSSEKTYFEIDVFEEFGPWKADSYHYSNT